jgi:hypothetical protein
MPSAELLVKVPVLTVVVVAKIAPPLPTALLAVYVVLAEVVVVE